MNAAAEILIWAACGAAAVLVAADVLRDRARQRREDRAWTDIAQILEES